jgi:hypothetical protein
MKRGVALSLFAKLGFAIMAVAVIGGCSNALETGYKPTPLGAASSERRAYYANPFTPESQGGGQGDQDISGQPDIHNPHPY